MLCREGKGVRRCPGPLSVERLRFPVSVECHWTGHRFKRDGRMVAWLIGTMGSVEEIDRTIAWGGAVRPMGSLHQGSDLHSVGECAHEEFLEG